jgi:multiple sugar transport system substrate-binding protein
MRKTYTVLALVAALAMAAAGGGCGRDSGDPNSEAAKPFSPGKAGGEITVWAMGTEGEKLTTFAAEFMKENPEATVKVTPIPWDGAHDKIATAIAGRQTPDLSLIGSTWMGEFAKTGGLDRLPDGVADQAAFFPGARDTTMVGGVAFGIPWYVETRLIYVNKEVAARAGVTTAPRSWEELKTAVKAFKDKGGAAWGVAFQAGGTGSWQTVLPFVWQNGGDVTSGGSGGTFTLDSAQAVEALAYFESYFNEGLNPKDLPQGTLEPDFAAGKIGAFVSGPWHIGILKEQGAAGKYDLWHMPTRKAATSFVGGGNLAVFKDAKNRDGAWKFVSWLAKPEVQVKWYQASSDLPSVKAAWDDPALKNDAMLSAFGAQLADAKAPPAIATWEQIAAAFDAEIERLVKTDLPAGDAAKAIQQKAVSIGTGA